MSDANKRIYFYSIRHSSYFFWLLRKNFTSTDKLLVLKYIIGGMLFLLFFPIVSLVVPEWPKLHDVFIEFLAIPITLSRDAPGYPICKNMQNKLYWYDTFTANNIRTPKVFCRTQKDASKIKLDDNALYITKPEYGTQGGGVEKITFADYKNRKYKTNMILQELLADCYTDRARHFRIITQCTQGWVTTFHISELTQTDDSKIASNRANNAKSVTCVNNICDFLSYEERIQVNSIQKKLITLHRNEFDIVPFIGWDVILTCDGAYVFEGNLGCSIHPSMYDIYIHELTEMYQLECPRHRKADPLRSKKYRSY